MRKVHVAFALSFLICCSSPVRATDPEPGRYKLFVARGLDTDLAVCILMLEKKDGGWAATMVGRNTALGKVTIGPAKMADGFLRIDVNISDEDMVFEGAGRDNKNIVGSCGNDRRLNIATMVPTDEDVIVRDRMKAQRDLPPPMKEYAKLEAERVELVKQSNRSTTVGDHNRIMDDLDQLRSKMASERQRLMAQVLAEHSKHPVAAEAGVILLNYADKTDATAEQLKAWTDTTLTAAATLGLRYRRDVLLLLVDAAGRNIKAQSLAAELAERADKELAATAPPALQSKLLAILVAALRASNQSDKATGAQERLSAIDKKLDEDFRARLPKIAIKPLGKRKEKANCVAFFEVFVGADGPSGAAVGPAFDKLMEAYKPNEAVVLQYHLHVPAPDALANADSEKRFDYYSQKYPQGADIIPCSFINGRPKAKGGGPLSEARAKCGDYCDAINPLVNEITPIKMTATAKRTEDKIEIEVKADGIPADAKDRGMRLRMALVEDGIRYPGANGLRIHNRVVRAMPGGVNGVGVIQESEKKQVVVNLTELRAKLNKALDKIAADDTPFSTPCRPMDFKNLKVIAWVQSDIDRAVWQAVQTDVTE